MRQRQRFLIWLAVLAAVWAVVNWPRAYLGSLKGFLMWAGLPWHFAHWEHGRLEWFDPVALVADVALGVAVAVPVAWLGAWSQDTVRSPIGVAQDAELLEGSQIREKKFP